MSKQEQLPASSTSLARIGELFGELRASRSKVEGVVDEFLSEIEAIRGQLAADEKKWQEASQANASGTGEDEIEELLLRLADAEATLERSKQEMHEERSLAQQGIAELDEETRQLIDDLINERDALHSELHNMRRAAEAKASS